MARSPSKLYYIPLNVKDWLTDTARLSLAAQGLFARILCLMLLEPEIGVYERTILEACRELGCTKEELLTHLSELSKFKTVRIDKDIVRVVSGRMQRDETDRKLNADYQTAHRRKAIVRDMSGDSKGQKLVVSSYKEKEKERESDTVRQVDPAPAYPKGLALDQPKERPRLPSPVKHPTQDLTDDEWAAGAEFFGKIKKNFGPLKIKSNGNGVFD